MIDEMEERKDAAHRSVIEIDNQINEVLIRKEQATKIGDRASWDKAIADLSWLGEQKKIRVQTFERVCREVDAEVRDAKLRELERERDLAEACTRRMATTAREAAEFLIAAERLRGVALALAEEQAQHSDAVRVLAQEIGVLTVCPSMSPREADELFGALVQREAQRAGLTIEPLRGLDTSPPENFTTREEHDDAE